jgi:hypothetical protein
VWCKAITRLDRATGAWLGRGGMVPPGEEFWAFYESYTDEYDRYGEDA